MKRKGYKIRLGTGSLLGMSTYNVTREDGTFVAGGGTQSDHHARKLVDAAIKKDRSKIENK